MDARNHEIETLPNSRPRAASTEERLIARINSLIASMGYEVAHLEIINQRQKLLRVFIDFTHDTAGKAIGIQDCVEVTRALDEPLDQTSEISEVFSGSYELEVSSPGADRPLRSERDFERFKGSEVRLHVYRPLTADELGNEEYFKKNPKQKNFFGRLMGLIPARTAAQSPAVLLEISREGGKSGGKKAGKKGRAVSASSATKSVDEVSIPFPLIAKANIEPQFEFDERE